MDGYTKSCQDELSLIEINQLHEATLQISKSCFEFKKICIGLIGVSATIIVKLTSNSMDNSYFVVPLLICFGFWIADFTAYYYQKSTRAVMNKKLDSIASRHGIDSYVGNENKPNWLQSAFNLSMSLYFVLGLLILIGWTLFIFDVIGTP